MSRLADRFARLRAAGRKALIPYVTAGDPAPGITVPLMQAMAAAGADVIELGVPFSDPMADGPVIQRASERALRHHVSLRTVLDMVRDFRRSDATWRCDVCTNHGDFAVDMMSGSRSASARSRPADAI